MGKKQNGVLEKKNNKIKFIKARHKPRGFTMTVTSDDLTGGGGGATAAAATGGTVPCPFN